MTYHQIDASFATRTYKIQTKYNMTSIILKEQPHNTVIICYSVERSIWTLTIWNINSKLRMHAQHCTAPFYRVAWKYFKTMLHVSVYQKRKLSICEYFSYFFILDLYMYWMSDMKFNGIMIGRLKFFRRSIWNKNTWIECVQLNYSKGPGYLRSVPLLFVFF